MDNVLVTGASRGIGLAIAERLAREGFRVLAVARRKSEAFDEAAAESAGALQFEACDLADIEAIPAFVRGLRARNGPIYGLVNNAGLGTEGLLATMANAVGLRSSVRPVGTAVREAPISKSETCVC